MAIVRDVSETARERETFRYDSSLIAGTVHNNASSLIPPSDLRSSPDPTLTAFAELAALRLGATRALISLFDSRFQYIVAEATPELALEADAPTPQDKPGQKLWLCGTAIPRSLSTCEHVLVGPQLANPGHNAPPPVTVIRDLTETRRSKGLIHCDPWSENRFYAGVPIQTRRGINIGVFCVFGDEPREDGLDASSTRLMQDLSRAIMGHLELGRARDEHRRADRMVRGFGSFVEGNTTMTGWEEGPSVESFNRSPAHEGSLNVNQQILHHRGSDAVWNDDVPSAAPKPPHPRGNTPPPTTHHRDQSKDAKPLASGIEVDATTAAREEDSRTAEIEHIFSKAANIIRESVEVEGVLFLDASISSSSGRASAEDIATRTPKNNQSSSSSGEERLGRSSSGRVAEGPEPFCRRLGFSTSSYSSIDGDAGSRDHLKISERFLRRLLRRYPKGKIFNFDESGSVQSSDFPGEDNMEAKSDSPETPKPLQAPQPEQLDPQTAGKSVRRPLSRQNEGKVIIGMFSGARSVAFMPLWDAQRQRWFAGGFAYTKTATRVLSVEGELSYLTAFGTSIVAEVFRANALMVSKSKTDLLSSVSHELRSPLHGIIFGTEMLRDTSLDAFQVDVLHSVEACGRTLLDTVDHLLDLSKINNFIRPVARPRDSVGDDGKRGLQSSKYNTIEAGMMSITSNVDVDVLAEEVIESVYAGYSFQRQSVSQLDSNRSPEQSIINPMRRFDTMQAVETLSSQNNRSSDTQIILGDVAVNLGIDPAPTWAFRTQPGALRRIIMNIAGNSLKYTTRGVIKIRLDQPASTTDAAGLAGVRVVRITVTDSGRGISEDYLKNHLFTPFAQENSLSAGVGLGLSLVKQIVVTLGGSVQVQSEVGKGTTVTVKLPLEVAAASSSPATEEEANDVWGSHSQIKELRGLRVLLLGFSACRDGEHENETPAVALDEHAAMARICRGWLGMHVVEPSEKEVLIPDLLLCNEHYIDWLPHERRNGSSTPAVVICRNALVARQLAMSPKFSATAGAGVVEFSSQPTGPRKLAKVLSLCFKRWTESQVAAVPVPSVSGTPSVDRACAPGPLGELPGLANVLGSASELPLESPTEEEILNMRLPGLPLQRKWQDPAAEPAQGEERRSHFLLVDDNPINLKMLAAYMTKLGHSYDTAMDGQQALDAFRDNAGQYRCVFMDISMPVMDGFEATRIIRKFERDSQLPRCAVFALTGLASADAQQEAFTSGIDLFVTKPVKIKELSQILARRGLA